VVKRKKNKQRRKEKGRKANTEERIDERKINMRGKQEETLALITC
jgi:hypothetical protein